MLHVHAALCLLDFVHCLRLQVGGGVGVFENVCVCVFSYCCVIWPEVHMGVIWGGFFSVLGDRVGASHVACDICLSVGYGKTCNTFINDMMLQQLPLSYVRGLVRKGYDKVGILSIYVLSSLRDKFKSSGAYHNA